MSPRSRALPGKAGTTTPVFAVVGVQNLVSPVEKVNLALTCHGREFVSEICR